MNQLKKCVLGREKEGSGEQGLKVWLCKLCAPQGYSYSKSFSNIFKN